MAKKRKRQGSPTAEERARHEKLQAMVRERIAYHEAKALEQEAKARGEG
jgi:hypothetical protein